MIWNWSGLFTSALRDNGKLIDYFDENDNICMIVGRVGIVIGEFGPIRSVSVRDHLLDESSIQGGIRIVFGGSVRATEVFQGS